MKIIAFYTVDTPYDKEAEEFRKSFAGEDYHIYQVSNKGKWELNCAQKSECIYKGLNDFEEDILYLDIDARKCRDIPEIKSDFPGFCIWQRPWKGEGDLELLSGTIFFPNNNLSKKIVEDWMEVQKADPSVWDQKTLQSIHNKYEHFEMDLEWVYIERFMKQVKNPIILHTQASRRLRNRV